MPIVVNPTGINGLHLNYKYAITELKATGIEDIIRETLREAHFL